MNRRLYLLPLVAGLSACGDQALTAPRVVSAPNFAIADAARAYKAGFYWLPPMVADPLYAGTFDAELAPTVEICELVDGACGPVIATYTMTTGPGSETVRLDLDDEHYIVNWHTDEFALSTTGFYRVSVRAGIYDVLLGFADVQPVDNGSGLKKIDTDEYIGLVDGRTLPIKFRIETGIVGNVEVQPVEATVEPEATQQFIAFLRDLHGELMTADVTWASSDEAVATVDQTGLATAVADGEATITVTSERITGSATLTVMGGDIVVSAGGSHTCALDSDGKAYCVGRGLEGQLGNGSTVFSATPVAVSGGLVFGAIDAGGFLSCALTTTGEAYCWGSGQFGGLGNGATANQSMPVAVSGFTFASISTGRGGACGVTPAGEGYCWGGAASGRLGNGTLNNQLTPAAVAGGLTFASISILSAHTCGVTTTNQAYCWGDKFDKQLGNPGNISTSQELSPVPVLGGHAFATIGVGTTHTCALTPGGQAYCWGSHRNGELGHGVAPIQGGLVTPQAVTGGLTFATITVGDNHTCGLTPTGQAYCWGLATRGQLGSVGANLRTAPTAVSGGLTFASLSAGSTHTCGVTTENQIYCWGTGGFGQLFTRGTPFLMAGFP